MCTSNIKVKKIRADKKNLKIKIKEKKTFEKSSHEQKNLSSSLVKKKTKKKLI